MGLPGKPKGFDGGEVERHFNETASETRVTGPGAPRAPKGRMKIEDARHWAEPRLTTGTAVVPLVADDVFSPFLPFSLLRFTDECGARLPSPTPAARFLRFPATEEGENRENTRREAASGAARARSPRGRTGGRNGENG
jgi:hypothetical protein